MMFGLKWWIIAQKASPSWNNSTINIIFITICISLIMIMVIVIIKIILIIIIIVLTLHEVDMSVMVTLG